MNRESAEECAAVVSEGSIEVANIPEECAGQKDLFTTLAIDKREDELSRVYRQPSSDEVIEDFESGLKKKAIRYGIPIATLIIAFAGYAYKDAA